jgi:hypothetical protein
MISSLNFLLSELESNRLSLDKIASLLKHCSEDDRLGTKLWWAALDKRARAGGAATDNHLRRAEISLLLWIGA